MLQNGVRWPDTGTDAVDRCVDRIVEGLELFREIVNGSAMFPQFLANSPLPLTPEALFAQGKLSMILTSYFHLNRLIDTDVDYDIAPIPGGREPKTMLIALGLAVSARASEQEAARLLVEYLVSDEAQTVLRSKTTSIPALRSAAEREDAAKAFERYSMYRDIIPTYAPLMEMGLPPDTLGRIMEAAQLYWSKLEDESALRGRLRALLEESTKRETATRTQP